MRSVENRVVELFLFNDFWQVCFQKDAEKQVAQKIPPKDLSFLGGKFRKITFVKKKSLDFFFLLNLPPTTALFLKSLLKVGLL